jgi:hypothetical protein
MLSTGSTLDAPPHIVRDMVGHSDIEVTMTIYTSRSMRSVRRSGSWEMPSADAVVVSVIVKRPGRRSPPRRSSCSERWSGKGSNCRPSAFRAEHSS